jgi:hypothetical protein
VYAACHCNDWQYQDSSNWPDPIGYSQVDPINMLGAYDTTNNFEVLPEFHTTQLDLTGSDGEGPWELFVDSNNCMWAGGDLVRLGTTASPFYGGYERFCGRDATAPTVPGNAKTTVAGNDVTLTWNASTDNVTTTPVRYEILKDDPTFGTIVMGTTFDRNFTDTNVVDPSRYFIRSVDAEGNRSATTSVLAVTPPPPATATLLAHGATWSYRSDGQDLGSSWRQPTFNSSSWATGASQLGWGGKGETTLIPSGPVTSYFVKHQSVTSPSQYETVTIRLKRDDGAVVYVNGVPAVRDNMPAGTITASTLASAFTSGSGETTWFEYQVPASLLKAGDNVIAVELHQAATNNADAIFDLELVARNGSETTAPTTPGPSVDDEEDSSVALSWTPSTDNIAVIGYLVRRGGTLLAFTAGTTFLDTGLSPGTTYGYQVTAVDTSGNVSSAGSVTAQTTGTLDTVAPVTTDNTASIGNAWKSTAQTVTLTPTDTGGSATTTTYSTTNGSTPTTASAQGTSITLAASGTYTIRYFSRDGAGNTEAVKTAGTTIRIDLASPTHTTSFPANNARYNSTGWKAGCTSTTDLCGTASDTGSGVASVRLRIQRSNNNQYWTGTAWQTAAATFTATGTTSWSAALPTTKLANGVTYTVTAWTVDQAGNVSPNTVRAFTYDTAKPTTAAASIVTTNKGGTINLNADKLTVTFNEALKPSTVPATATLTLARSNGNTSYGITGLTNGLRTTGAAGYLGSSPTTRFITFTGSLVLSNSNKTVTFTVTGACAGQCSARISTKSAGAFQFVPATTLRDVAGNAPATTVITAPSQVMF